MCEACDCDTVCVADVYVSKVNYQVYRDVLLGIMRDFLDAGHSPAELEAALELHPHEADVARLMRQVVALAQCPEE